MRGVQLLGGVGVLQLDVCCCCRCSCRCRCRGGGSVLRLDDRVLLLLPVPMEPASVDVDDVWQGRGSRHTGEECDGKKDRSEARGKMDEYAGSEAKQRMWNRERKTSGRPEK